MHEPPDFEIKNQFDTSREYSKISRESLQLHSNNVSFIEVFCGYLSDKKGWKRAEFTERNGDALKTSKLMVLLQKRICWKQVRHIEILSFC